MSTAHIPIFGSVDELLLGVLRNALADDQVHIGTLYSEGLTPPIVIVRRDRRSGSLGLENDDDRFMQSAVVSVNTLTAGENADEDGEELHEACRIAIREAHLNQTVIPGCGHIAAVLNSITPARVSDWATSSGAVQYASLPKGWVRFESVYRLLIRPPDQSTVNNRFITPAS